ncbi:hypothetical protein PINS_up007273 [Pythium insidiosum]|nr:hypothetical protein PINS_up007273 [Pythium insidiosum]
MDSSAAWQTTGDNAEYAESIEAQTADAYAAYSYQDDTAYFDAYAQELDPTYSDQTYNQAGNQEPDPAAWEQAFGYDDAGYPMDEQLAQLDLGYHPLDENNQPPEYDPAQYEQAGGYNYGYADDSQLSYSYFYDSVDPNAPMSPFGDETYWQQYGEVPVVGADAEASEPRGDNEEATASAVPEPGVIDIKQAEIPSTPETPATSASSVAGGTPSEPGKRKKKVGECTDLSPFVRDADQLYRENQSRIAFKSAKKHLRRRKKNVGRRCKQMAHQVARLESQQLLQVC